MWGNKACKLTSNITVQRCSMQMARASGVPGKTGQKSVTSNESQSSQVQFLEICTKNPQYWLALKKNQYIQAFKKPLYWALKKMYFFLNYRHNFWSKVFQKEKIAKFM